MLMEIHSFYTSHKTIKQTYSNSNIDFTPIAIIKLKSNYNILTFRKLFTLT